MKKLLLAAVAVAVTAAAIVAYMYLRPPATASQPIEAIPIVLATPAETAATATEVETTETATTEAATTEAAPAEAAPVEAAAPVIFEIIPEQSEARFIIDEVLNGAPTTVVGATNQVAGQIAVDSATPTNTQLGVIQINARTLATDNNMRNRAISNRILFTDQYEYITFTPAAVTGMPATITVGQAIPVQISGDLTVLDTTLPVTFEAQITPVSETQLQGSASAVIRYADFGINIPQVPSVTGVEDEVTLQIDFVAAPV
jgi:polyisoprenoid-binding protein YceI